MEEEKRIELVKKWEREAPLYTQLPIQYQSGVTFNEIDCKCLICSQVIPQDNVHGVINRPIESVATVDALGWCRACNTLTPFYFRVRGDNNQLTMEWIDKEKGWVRSVSHESFVKKILKWIS